MTLFAKVHTHTHCHYLIGFLRRARSRLGPIFGINLAGRTIYLISSTSAIKSYYNSDENILNAHEANSSFGFAKKSTIKVPKLNRHVILMKLNPELESHFVPLHTKEFGYFLEGELNEKGCRLNLFKDMAKICLLSFVSSFIDRSIVVGGEEGNESVFMREYYRHEALKKQYV